MTGKQQPVTIPAHLLILDVLGMVLIGLGAAELSGTLDFFAGLIPFEHYHWVMIFVGILLTAPFILYLVKSAQGGKNTPSE